MAPRPQPQDSAQATIETIAGKVRTLDTTVKDRALPPNYVFNIDAAGNLVITRQSDGKTSILEFS